MDGGFHLHAFLGMNDKRPRRLSPKEATVGAERLNVVGKGIRKILDARMYIHKEYIDVRGLEKDFNDSSNKLQRF